MGLYLSYAEAEGKGRKKNIRSNHKGYTKYTVVKAAFSVLKFADLSSFWSDFLQQTCGNKPEIYC